MATSSLAQIGTLIGDESRAALLATLLDGRAHTVGELARAARVAVSTASGHLCRLLDGGLVTVEARGRYRYYRLAGPDVARMLENLLAVSATDIRPPATRTPVELRFARTCYDHLAGTLGVALRDRLVGPGEIGSTLPDSAADALAALGVDLDTVGARRYPVVRGCLDWSERRHHLAGPAAAALLRTALDRHWLVRRRTPRAVRLTNTGRAAFTEALGPDPRWTTQLASPTR